MTKRDFFIIALKLFGLNVIVSTLFSTIPNYMIQSLSYMDLTSIIWTSLVLVVTIGLFWLFIAKADWVVGLLNLDKGFKDDRIEFGHLNSSDIIKIGVFISGGLVMINFIPKFLSHAYWAFKGSIAGREFDHGDQFNLAVSGLNVLLGYLLMTNYQFVADRFKSKKAEE